MSPHACGWIPSSVTKRRSLGLISKNAAGFQGPTPTSLQAGENNVIDFVQGFPSALSAAEEASTAVAPALSSSLLAYESEGGAVNMAIPNWAVLAGGGVIFLLFASLALFFLYQGNQGTEDDMTANGVSQSFENRIEEVMPISKTNVDPNGLSQQLGAAEAKYQEKYAPTPPPKTIPVEQKIEQPPPPTPKPAPVEQKIEQPPSPPPVPKPAPVATIESIEVDTEVKTEIATKPVQTKLEEGNIQYEKTTEKEESQAQALAEVMEKWQYTKAKLEAEIELKQKLESELKEVAESNRVLEDKYELEQNALMKTTTDLESTKSTLEATKSRLDRTQSELTRIFAQLEITKQVLVETELEMANLELEQQSFRKLGRNAWRLSKSRVSNRVKSIGNRLRGPKKNRKRKNY